MTHNDIYTKFMIEYDKANITSSYPSLTEYEIATILDKAYLAIIAQKLTGNNPRKAPFEADIKAIEDIRPLIKTSSATSKLPDMVSGITNSMIFNMPDDLLYYVQGTIQLYSNVQSDDTKATRVLPVTLVSHESAQHYFATSNNLPWIPIPVVYIEGTYMIVLYDSYQYNENGVTTPNYYVTYISKPLKFLDTLTSTTVMFELNDTMAEEVIDMAIIMATEIVESQRLVTKVQTKQFES